MTNKGFKNKEAFSGDLEAILLACRATGGSFEDAIRMIRRNVLSVQQRIGLIEKILELKCRYPFSAVRAIAEILRSTHPAKRQQFAEPIRNAGIHPWSIGVALNMQVEAARALVVGIGLSKKEAFAIKETGPRGRRNDLCLWGYRGDELPRGLILHGKVTVRECRELVRLPGDLKVNGSLAVRGCPRLAFLPENFEVLGSLEIARCPSLTRLPPGLRVKGGLDVDQCEGFLGFSERTEIGDSILVSKAPAWDGKLPDDLVIRFDGVAVFRDWNDKEGRGRAGTLEAWRAGKAYRTR